MKFSYKILVYTGPRTNGPVWTRTSVWLIPAVYLNFCCKINFLNLMFSQYLFQKHPILTVFLSEAVARRCSVRKCVLRNFVKFTGKHLCQCWLRLRPATLLKKRLRHGCFPVNFAKFLKTPFLTEQLRWLLLFLKKTISFTVYIYGYLDKITKSKLKRSVCKRKFQL